MAYKKLHKNYIKNQYIKVFKIEMGVKRLTKEEDEFLSKFTRLQNDSPAKIIFFNVVDRFYRFYPKFLIRFLVRKDLKKAFKREKAPISIYKISDALAEDIFFKAMFYHCKKIGDFRKVGIVRVFQEDSSFEKFKKSLLTLFKF